jgi:hypothetical protein
MTKDTASDYFGLALYNFSGFEGVESNNKTLIGFIWWVQKFDVGFNSKETIYKNLQWNSL